MAFLYYVMFIHKVFIFKKQAYRAFCLPLRTGSMTAVYQVKIKYDQVKFGAIFWHDRKGGKLSSWR